MLYVNVHLEFGILFEQADVWQWVTRVRLAHKLISGLDLKAYTWLLLKGFHRQSEIKATKQDTRGVFQDSNSKYVPIAFIIKAQELILCTIFSLTWIKSNFQIKFANSNKNELNAMLT